MKTGTANLPLHHGRVPGWLGETLGLDGAALVKTSRLVAKVHSNAVQDGYQLYLHNFILSAEGHWVVIQQDMNPKHRQARRYHWLSENLTSFVDAPHAAIEGPSEGAIVNLTDHRAVTSRELQTRLTTHEDPQTLVRQFEQIILHLKMPSHREVKKENINIKRLYATLKAAKECSPKDFSELLLTPGLGERSLWALTVVAEMVHGGKDRHPYLVPLKVYDETLRVLKSAVTQAKLGNQDKLCAIQRLDEATRRIEKEAVVDFDWEGFSGEERRRFPEWEGKWVGNGG